MAEQISYTVKVSKRLKERFCKKAKEQEDRTGAYVLRRFMEQYVGSSETVDMFEGKK